MASFWIAAIGIAGTLSAAVLTQWLQGRAADRQSRDAERRRIMDLRREALAVFAEELMSYRRAQLHNWHLAREHALDRDETDVSAEVRQLRARSWAAFYRVQLLWPDPAIISGARRLVDAVTDLKRLDDEDTLGRSADLIREDLSQVMDQGRDSLLMVTGTASS